MDIGLKLCVVFLLMVFAVEGGTLFWHNMAGGYQVGLSAQYDRISYSAAVSVCAAAAAQIYPHNAADDFYLWGWMPQRYWYYWVYTADTSRGYCDEVYHSGDARTRTLYVMTSACTMQRSYICYRPPEETTTTTEEPTTTTTQEETTTTTEEPTTTTTQEETTTTTEEPMTTTTQACGEMVSGSGFLTSPNFPNNYADNEDCLWQITNSGGVKIIFHDFNLESHSSCNWDYLEVRNGPDSDAPLMGKYCGATIPDPLTSSSSNMRIRFYSDGSVTRKGFKLEYMPA